MTTRCCLLFVAGLAPLAFIAGCASTPPPKTAAAEPAPIWTETTGTGTTTEHKTIQSYNRQMLNSEHAMDSNPPDVTTGVNQGIP